MTVEENLLSWTAASQETVRVKTSYFQVTPINRQYEQFELVEECVRNQLVLTNLEVRHPRCVGSRDFQFYYSVPG
jgi:hypothetical protein